MKLETKKFKCIECNNEFDTYVENCSACGANLLKSEDLQKKSMISDVIDDITRNMITELVKRNKDLPPSEALKITTMAGCSAINK